MAEAWPEWQHVSRDPRIEQILAVMASETQVPRERLMPATSIEELGIASLDLIQTIFELETRFDVEIPELSADIAKEFLTVGDLVQHVLASLDKASTSAAAGGIRPA